MRRKQLTQKQKEAIDLLIKGWTDSEVCKLIKINIATLWRWKQKDIFKEKIGKVQQQQNNIVITQVADLVDKSKEILTESLERREKKLPGYVKVALEILKIYRPSLKGKDVEKETPTSQPEKEKKNDVTLSSEEFEKMLENPYTDEKSNE